MTKKSKTKELSTAELEKVQGGERISLSYEEIKPSYATRSTVKQKTIIGGFKSLSGEDESV